MRLKIVLVVVTFCGHAVGFAQEGGVENVDILEKAIEREAVPAEVLADAVKATQEVGDQT